MRAGFTLFEVGVSLWIMAIAVTTVLMVLPTGIQVQQAARYQFLAAAKAQSIVQAASSPTLHAWSTVFFEGNTLVDGASVNAGSQMPDLHQIANTFVHGLGNPLPSTIARRLDSEGDEIAQILDEGGVILYQPPFAVNSFDHSSASQVTPVDAGARRLIFGFRGYPQQNALISHPQRAWPYVTPQPGRGAPWEARIWTDAAIPNPGVDTYATTRSALTAIGLPDPLVDVPDVADWYAILNPDDKFPVACLLLRNHAQASLKRASDTPGDAAFVAQARIDHDWMLHFLMYASLEQPDDLRIPRLPQSMIMTDIPLLQYDLFGTAVTSSAGDYPARRANATDAPWKIYPLLSERTQRYTRSWTSDNTPVVPTVGNGRFHLTAPFEAAERMRQLVVWSVDWQSYEDAESTPAAPIDSMRLSWRPMNATTAVRQQPDWGLRLPNEWIGHFTDANRTATLNWDAYGFHGQSGHILGAWASKPPLAARIYLGRFGTDRNGNGVHDIGPTRAAVRLRAVTVARFNMYDPIAHVVTR